MKLSKRQRDIIAGRVPEALINLELPTCTGFNTDQSLEVIWAVLHAFKEERDRLVETSHEHLIDIFDAQWDDICTAMAWISEALVPESEETTEPPYEKRTT